jgi:Mg-chelatase subunit ChlD
VVALGREQRERLLRRRELIRLPLPLLLALALHAALVIWLWSVRGLLGDGDAERLIHASVEDVELIEPLQLVEPEPPELQPPEPEPLEDPRVVDLEPTDAIPMPDELVLPAENLLGVGGSAARGPGGGRRSGLSAGGIPDLDAMPGGSGFRAFVSDLRARGLDVVFVVDATASMERFIERARATIDGIIADLSAVVPDLRLGLVAYRDQADDWITQHVDLTDDRYHIHNFLADLEADGGGDFEEAVDQGLRLAADRLAWRPGARRVVVLVGDAPPHPDDESAAVQVVRAFSRDVHSAVSVLYTGSTNAARPTARDERTRAVLDKIARSGGGILADLQEERGSLRDRILDASFGTEWSGAIRELLGLREADWRQRLVARKVAADDRKWLLRNLGSTPVHPAVVDGCIALFDRAVGERAMELLLDERRPDAVRSAALYVLKRGVIGGLPIDIHQPLAGQQGALEKLRRELDKLEPVGDAGRSTRPPPSPR